MQSHAPLYLNHTQPLGFPLKNMSNMINNSQGVVSFSNIDIHIKKDLSKWSNYINQSFDAFYQTPFIQYILSMKINIKHPLFK